MCHYGRLFESVCTQHMASRDMFVCVFVCVCVFASRERMAAGSLQQVGSTGGSHSPQSDSLDGDRENLNGRGPCGWEEFDKM